MIAFQANYIHLLQSTGTFDALCKDMNDWWKQVFHEEIF